MSRKITLGIGLAMILAAWEACAAATSYTIDLAPGQGTILLLGTAADHDSVQAAYFAPNAPDPAGPLKHMPMGFYTSTTWGSSWADRGRMLALYTGAGASAVFACDGYMTGGAGSYANQFANLAAQNNLLAFIQPVDLYFPDTPPAGYSSVADWRDRYMIPHLTLYAPYHRDNLNIFAWAPREECPVSLEPDLAIYRQAWKQQMPRHYLYQLDSQQRDAATMTKQPPYPDIAGFDRYPWWVVPYGSNYMLWTPDYALRWLFGEIKEYPKAAYTELNGAPAIFVQQGCAELTFLSRAGGEALGWVADPAWHLSTAPNVGWLPGVGGTGMFYYWGRYLAPANAWRCQSWIGVAAGYKGLMYWSAGPLGGPVDLANAWATGTATRVGLIDDNLTISPHLGEVTQSWNEIRTLEKLILALHYQDFSSQYTISDSKVFSNTFTDAAGRKYVVVVNADIGTWDATNPEWLNWPQTRLTVDQNGELSHYTPKTGVRTVTVQVGGSGVGLFDLRTLVPMATLQAAVTLGDYAGDYRDVCVEVQLLNGPSSPLVCRQFLTSGGQFTIDNILPGTYTLTVKSYTSLQRVIRGLTLAVGSNTLGSAISLINGDMDGSNVVDSRDLSVVLKNLDVTGEQ